MTTSEPTQRTPTQRTNVCLVTAGYNIVLRRQTPKDDFVWNTLRVSFNNEEGCSWLCIYDDWLPMHWTTTIPKHRRILVVTEPKEILRYSRTCLNQYGTVLSPYPRPYFYWGRWINAPVLFPWFYGYKERRSPMSYLSWNALRRAKTNKTKTLSVIYTQKKYTRSQIQRTRFVKALEQELGEKLDIFGRSKEHIADKKDSIDPYRYHLVLENGTGPHFWSEKLADCYLGESYPIHASCPNLHDYFPQEAYTSIDIFNIPQAIQQVKDIIASDLYEKNRASILEAKRRVMEEHQLFPMLARVISEAPQQPYHPLEKPVILRRCTQVLDTIYGFHRRYFRISYYQHRLHRIKNSIKRYLPF